MRMRMTMTTMPLYCCPHPPHLKTILFQAVDSVLLIQFCSPPSCQCSHTRLPSNGSLIQLSVRQTEHTPEEDICVESYCVIVPSGQCAKYDGNSFQTICSVDAKLATQNEDGWTTIIGKQKKNGFKNCWDQEKENKRIHG